MKQPLLALAPSELRTLASALSTGRLGEPYSRMSIGRFVNESVAPGVAASIQELSVAGMSSLAVARTLVLLADGLAERPLLEDLVDLVTTGPEVGGVTNRETAAVVGDLFRKAEHSILVAGYAVYQGQKVFQALADRMLQFPDLKVHMYLDIQRRPGDTSAAAELVLAFAHRFRTSQWPPERPLPKLYYASQSLALERDQCTALHAKCVVVDNRDVFISSANFTEAAQERNIEVGILFHSNVVAERVGSFFDSLVAAETLKQVF